MLRPLHALLSLALGLAQTHAGPPPGAPVVDLGYARYAGNLTFPDTAAFLGLPYAEPPLGALRWRAPLPLNTTRVAAEARGRVVDASAYPDFCVQGTTGDGFGGAGSEDCLKVNVYAPANATRDSKLPVLVYIHGGGYVFGNPASWPFDHWIHQSPNVVIVSVYYRLDSFGFLSTPAFSADASLGTHNAGLLDQQLALRWVQQHVGAFGGDAARVTINGESAGGSSVALQMVIPSSRGLFRAVIAQSVYRTPLPTPAQQQPLFAFFAETAGCGAGSVQQQLACLRTVPVSALARAQDEALLPPSTFTGAYNMFRPVLDGAFIPALPTELFLSGQFTRVPLIVGATSNETLSGSTDLAGELKAFFPALTNASLAAYARIYNSSEFANEAQAITDATGESELRCARTIMGEASAPHARTWTYRYNTANPTDGDPAAGVGHAAENWMMFRGTNTGANGTFAFSPQSVAEQAFAAELIAYWLSFVRAGDPGVFKLQGSPAWPAYGGAGSAEQRVVLQQGPDAGGSGSFVEVEPRAENARCQFVASLVQQQQN